MSVIRDPILVFDIETVPDVETGRKLHGLDGLSDDETRAAMSSLRLQARGNDFQPPHLQRIVAISAVLRTAETFKVWSLGEPESDEAELVHRFFEGVDKFRPVLVSWNGGGFDLPVLTYRALKHGIPAARFWQMDGDAKWDNYIGRFHFRHTDLMDVLALYQNRAFAPLHEIAVLLGLPGKLGMDGSQVAGAFAAGKIAEIRAYCETDVVNTYLVYLRFLLVRAVLTAEQYVAEVARVRTHLKQSEAAHWKEFLAAWN